MRNGRSVGAIGVSALWVAVFCSALWARQELPDGPGRDVTVKLCVNSCHGPGKLLAEHRSKSQWNETIENMKFEGAKGTDEEFRESLTYLVTHFGIQVKINTATARQIDDALDLEAGQAAAIVKYREDRGPFADLAALLSVPGLDAARVTAQKTNIVF